MTLSSSISTINASRMHEEIVRLMPLQKVSTTIGSTRRGEMYIHAHQIDRVLCR